MDTRRRGDSAGRPDAASELVVRARAAAASLPRSDVRDKARVVLADAFALARGCARDVDGRTAVAVADAAPDGPATVIGRTRRVASESAVLANATLIHGRLLDDAHADTMVHPAAVVIPVALATAEEVGAAPATLLAALVAGYEVFAAAAEPTAALTAASGFRNTALYGPLAAAAAAGCVLDLDDARLTAALLIASGSAGGTLQAFRSDSPEWRFQPGLAGQLGLAAARLARALDPTLLPLSRGALEGPFGLYATYTGRPQAAVGIGAAGEPAILAVTHKRHATCGANQVPVSALAALLRAGVRAEHIARIDVHLSPASFGYPGCEDYGPFAAGGTYLSRPFALAATVLAAGEPLDESSARRALAHPGLDALARRVTSHVAPEGSLRDAQDAWVEVTLVDGTRRRAGRSDVDPSDLTPDWAAMAARLRSADPRTADALVAALERLPGGELADLTRPLRLAPEPPEES